jgi:hypothetical protein
MEFARALSHTHVSPGCLVIRRVSNAAALLRHPAARPAARRALRPAAVAEIAPAPSPLREAAPAAADATIVDVSPTPARRPAGRARRRSTWSLVCWFNGAAAAAARSPAACPGPRLQVASREDFQQLLAANKDRLVVLMCKAKGCHPCKVRRTPLLWARALPPSPPPLSAPAKFAPECNAPRPPSPIPPQAFRSKYAALGRHYSGGVFAEVMGDRNESTRALMKAMKVKATPTFAVFVGGEQVHMHSGVKAEKLIEALAAHSPAGSPGNGADPAALEAELADA